MDTKKTEQDILLDLYFQINREERIADEIKKKDPGRYNIHRTYIQSLKDKYDKLKNENE